MNEELTFLIRVIRNAVILSGLYFFSIYATANVLTYQVCKPVVVFLGTYVFTELGSKYGLQKTNLSALNKRANITLIL